MLLFTDSLLTETAICFQIPDFNKSILICKISHDKKCSKKQFWKFLYIELVHSLNLSVGVRLRSVSWKLVEDMLTRLIFLEWFVLNTSWRCLKDVLTRPVFFRVIEDILKTSLQDFLITSWKRVDDIFARCLEDIFKTPCRLMTKANIFILIKTSKTSPEDVWQRWIYSSWIHLENNFWR